MNPDTAAIFTRLLAAIPPDRLTEMRDLAARKGWLAVEILAERHQADGRMDEAIQAWIACAVEDGSPPALLNLARHLDGDDGRVLLEAAAEGGEGEAALLLAERNEGAAGIPWLRRAALLGDMDAAFEMVDRLVAAGTPEDDDSDARHWLELAARYGHAGARYALGALLVEDGNVEAGLRWLRRAAFDRVAEAKAMLDGMEASLYATPTDEKRAFTVLFPGQVTAFDDLAWLDEESLQELIRKTEASTLATALRNAEPEVLDAFRANISERAWQYLVRDMLTDPAPDAETVSRARTELVIGANAIPYRPPPEARFLTQQEIDDLLGVTEDDIRRWEADGRPRTEMDDILDSIRRILADDDGICRPRRVRPRDEEPPTMGEILASIRGILEDS